jgi:hypothetical protein
MATLTGKDSLSFYDDYKYHQGMVMNEYFTNIHAVPNDEFMKVENMTFKEARERIDKQYFEALINLQAAKQSSSSQLPTDHVRIDRG